ncbi:hypothetical protein SJI19_10125 [Acerihabitans sp. TG2]|uniref:hypothetical protein n=1 Tax=Acerihabitans sp. TG2 TaxID=3096008 RepID=UPI002B237E50|nr:hypothetical protein [Acerihabitans sp. TG2]MEA9390896.1 hypothetical protein [Acerihabitans sp. TG2]
MSNGRLAAVVPLILSSSLAWPAGQRDPFQPGTRSTDILRSAAQGAIKGWVVDGERRQLLSTDGQGHWMLRGDIPQDAPDCVQDDGTMGTITEHKDDEL